MRAVRLDLSPPHAPRILTDLREPECGPGEALVRVSRTLLSPADSACVSRGTFRGVLGSQFVGVIKQANVPDGASASIAARKGWVGKRVVAAPSIACASCDLCRGGLSVHCRARKVLGIHERDGGLCDMVSVPLGALHLVPDSVNDLCAPFAHMVSGALHAGNMLRSEQKSFITVLGDSAVALVCAQVLARMNTSVRLLSSRPDRLRLCERWGIRHRAIDEPGRRQDQDVVVDCTGTSAGLGLALQMVRPRGIVLLKDPAAQRPMAMGAGGDGQGWKTPVDLSPAVVNEVQILGSRDGPMPDALRVLSEQTVDVAALITRRMKLEDAPEALRLIATGEPTAIVIEID